MRNVYLLCCLVFLTACFSEGTLSEKVDAALQKNDLLLAEEILQDEIEQDNAQAKALLAQLILKGQTADTANMDSTPENKKKKEEMIMPLLKEAVAQDNAMAQYLLAMSILRQSPVPKERSNRVNQLMLRSAEKGFVPALMDRVMENPLMYYGVKGSEYLLADLSIYSLQSDNGENVYCKFDLPEYLPNNYLYKLKSELDGSADEKRELIIKSAKCLLADLEKINEKIRSGISIFEGRIFSGQVSEYAMRGSLKEGVIFKNPDVLLALGDMIALLKPEWTTAVDYGNLDPNRYETVLTANGIDFYYQAIVNASDHFQFAKTKARAREKLSKRADAGSLIASRKFALLPSDGKQQTSKEAIKKLKSAAKQGDPVSMRRLGQAYLEEQNIDEAVKWLQFAAYSYDDKAMGILSNVWEASSNPDEQVLGAFWGQFAVQMGNDELQNVLFISDSSIEMEEIASFLLDLKYDARGKDIPTEMFDAGSSLHIARAAKRLQQMKNTTIKQAAKDNKIIDDLLLRAEQGDLSAMTKLGKRYYEGEGVTENKKRAFQLYQQARRHSNEADKILNILLKYDEKIKALFDEQQLALSTYDVKAKSGNINAINYLIKAYSTGVDAPYDPAKARRYQYLLENMESKVLQ